MVLELQCRYTADMANTDLGRLLGSRLRQIRKALAGTQEEFCARSGLSQSHLSRLETGVGWSGLRHLAEAIERAGGDPEDLIRPDPPANDQAEVEIRALLPEADVGTREVVLRILRIDALWPLSGVRPKRLSRPRHLLS